MKLNELKQASNSFKEFIDRLVANEDTIKGVFTIRDASIRESLDSNSGPTNGTLESKLRFRFMAREDPETSHLLLVKNGQKNAKDNGIFSDAGYYAEISYITFMNALNHHNSDDIHDLRNAIACILGNPENDNDAKRASALTELLRGIRISFVQSALCDKDEYLQSNGSIWKTQPGQYSVITEIVKILPAA